MDASDDGRADGQKMDRKGVTTLSFTVILIEQGGKIVIIWRTA